MIKGSKSRPLSLAQQEYEERWDAIFGRPTQRELDEEKSKVEVPQELPKTEINDSAQEG